MSPTLTGKKSRRCKKKLEWRKEKEKNFFSTKYKLFFKFS